MARPREFDETAALQAAMRAFWSKGYEGTSIGDLTEAMGVSRSTLYASFGEKDLIFDRALELYAEEISSERYAILRNARSVRQGLQDYFRNHIDVATGSRYPGGCLLVNTAAESGSVSERVAEVVARRADRAEKAIRALLERGRDAGELPVKADIAGLARMFLAVTYGIHILAKMGRDRRNLNGMVESALRSLG